MRAFQKVIRNGRLFDGEGPKTDFYKRLSHSQPSDRAHAAPLYGSTAPWNHALDRVSPGFSALKASAMVGLTTDSPLALAHDVLGAVRSHGKIRGRPRIFTGPPYFFQIFPQRSSVATQRHANPRRLLLVLLFSALFFSAIMSSAGAGAGAGAAPSAVDARPTAIVSSSKAASSPSPRRSQARGLPGLAVLKKYTKGRLPTLLNGNLEFRVHKKYPGSGPVMVLHNERAA